VLGLIAGAACVRDDDRGVVVTAVDTDVLKDIVARTLSSRGDVFG
jgi:phage terminase large subunit GpA-like protein